MNLYYITIDYTPNAWHGYRRRLQTAITESAAIALAKKAAEYPHAFVDVYVYTDSNKREYVGTWAGREAKAILGLDD